MVTKLRVGFLLVKSLMTCLGIIVISACGMFVRTYLKIVDNMNTRTYNRHHASPAR